MSEQDITIEQPQIEIPKLEQTPVTVEEWAAFSAAQAETIQELTRQVANLSETVMYLTRKLFGSSSEKSDGIEGQLSLFNEAESEADPDVEEPSEETVVGGYLRNRKQRGTHDEILGNIPVRQIPCDVPPDERICEYCGSEMDVLGHQVVREELHITPMKLERIQYVQEVLICSRCKYEDDEPNIVRALTPSPLIPHSLASASSVAYIMYQKYVNAMPLYRQEQDLLRVGVRIIRAVMANWIITCALEYFTPLYEAMHTQLLERAVIHADETPCQVLKEEGREAATKSYMWLYASGNDGLPGIILYEYQPGRGAQHPKKFLEGFHGFLQTDAYDGYNELEEHLTRCTCWVHARRYWFDALPGNTGKKKSGQAELSPAEIGYAYCNKLFEYERGMGGLTPDGRKDARMKKEKPLLDRYWKWLWSLNPYGAAVWRKQ
ncbi:MAG: IS66 family transposase [Blautia sp.]|nr:IS66 family transposase [Blautia sp.]